MPKTNATKPAPIKADDLGRYNGDLETVFVPRPDIGSRDCYDAATLKLEQAERLLQVERMNNEEGQPDWVVQAALALLQQARAGFQSAQMRA